jgi:hypothetical protein
MHGRVSVAALPALLAGCAAAQPTSLHSSTDLQPGMAYICLAPDGTLARETFEPSGSVTCPAPARYVSQPYCKEVPAPPRDILAYERARGIAARDGTLIGDLFEGQSFCAVPKRGPPPARS